MTKNLDFLAQLENFRQESSIAARFTYAEMSIQHAASKSKKLLNSLNNTPTFWIVCELALQSSAYISIHSIFNKKSTYNIHSLLDSMEQNLLIFQREALSQRKCEILTNHVDLDDYLANAYYPTVRDVRRLRKLVAKYNAISDRAVSPVRNKYIAHRVVTQRESQALYASGEIREFWRLTTFLLQLHDILWEQYHNSKKPIFRQTRYSVKSIYDANYQYSAPHESIVSDVKKLMQFMEFATLKNLAL